MTAAATDVRAADPRKAGRFVYGAGVVLLCA